MGFYEEKLIFEKKLEKWNEIGKKEKYKNLFLSRNERILFQNNSNFLILLRYLKNELDDFSKKYLSIKERKIKIIWEEKGIISAQNRKYNSRNMKTIGIRYFCRQK